jgi:hypothetical protein
MQILNEIMLTEPPQWIETMTTIGLIMIIAGVVLMIGISIMLDSVGAFVSGLIIIFVGLILAVVGTVAEEKVEPLPTGITQYEVLIDESVNFQEVYDKYEVIERRGEIWVLQDKESEE